MIADFHAQYPMDSYPHTRQKTRAAFQVYHRRMHKINAYPFYGRKYCWTCWLKQYEYYMDTGVLQYWQDPTEVVLEVLAGTVSVLH